MTLIFLLLSVACAVSAQSVDFENSAHLTRNDGWGCATAFHHDEYVITTCSSFNSSTDLLPVYEAQVWDCSVTPCVEGQVIIPADLSSDYLYLQSYERIDSDRFLFVSVRGEESNIYECVIDDDTFLCDVLFNFPEFGEDYTDFNVLAFSSDKNGNLRTIASIYNNPLGRSMLVHLDCLNTTNQCILIKIEDVNEIYGSELLWRALVFNLGNDVIFTDVYHDNSRGAVFKLQCRPVSVTMSELDPNCTLVSISTLSDAYPSSLFGYEIVGRMIGTDIGLLVGVPGFTSDGFYVQGAVASLLCSTMFGLNSPCTAHEVELHIGPSQNCLWNICNFGDINAIALDVTGRHFAVGVAQADAGLGEITVYSCSDMPIVLCAHAGTFSPNYPPYSDFYGVWISYNNNGTLLSVTASEYGFVNGFEPINLWTVNTYYNDTIPGNYLKTIEKVKNIVAKKSVASKWTDEQDKVYIDQHVVRLSKLKTKLGL